MSINLINTNRVFEINSKIIEWDMRRAGLSLIREFNLLPDYKIEDLMTLEKKECDIKIGKLQIKDKEFSRELEQKFTDVMNQFLEVNEIDKEYDVLAIKKDACFVINKKVTYFKFGTYIEFVPKNEYHAYAYIKPLEMYFKKNDSVDIKGLISDKTRRNEIMKLHHDGILNFLGFVIKLCETTNMDYKKINNFLHEFVEMYKRKELDFDYYREFNIESRFKYQFLGSEMMTDNIDEKMLDKVNIEYNYIHIILPFINLIV